ADDVLAKYGGGVGAAEAAPAAPEASEADAPGPEAAPEEATASDHGESGTAPAPAAGGDGAAKPAEAVPGGYGQATGGTAPVAAPAAPDAGDGGGRIKASPLARRMAEEQGLDLRALTGSGPEGRIVKRDVEAALEGKGPAQAPASPAQPEPPRPAEAPAKAPAPVPPAAPALEEGAYESVPLSQMRKTIARRLAQSKFTAPHFYLTLDIDMARAVDFRRQLNEVAERQERTRVSFNDLITKACAMALRRHPAVNSSWLEEEGEIRRHRDVHVAVAVAIDEGLMTPVVRHADRKGLSEIAEETQALAERARNRQLQ